MSKKVLFFVGGFVLVIAGVALTLRDWLFVQLVFRGVIGPVLAVAGMVVLALASMASAASAASAAKD
jgi:hypothetical protein